MDLFVKALQEEVNSVTKTSSSLLPFRVLSRDEKKNAIPLSKKLLLGADRHAWMLMIFCKTHSQRCQGQN